MKLKLSVLFVLLLISTKVFSQSNFVLKGLVTDAKTQEPMPFATVFFAGSTFGTTTNDKGEYLLRVDKSGTYDLVVKFMGYDTYAAQVRLGAAEVSKLDIAITPSARDLGSVVVVAKKDANWRKYLEEFEVVFLGQSVNAMNSKILNKEVLDFSYDEEKDQLSAFSDEALIVENKELGYEVEYYLEQFIIDYNSNFSGYFGYTNFKSIEPKNDRRAKVLERNRKKTYNGSATHFLRSLYANQLEEEGFRVKLSKDGGEKGFIPYDKPINLYGMLKDGDDGSHKKLAFDDYLAITYLNEKVSSRYRSVISQSASKGLTITTDGDIIQESWILILEGNSTIDFEPNGYIRNPMSFYSLGYWAFEKVADMVPLDYAPASNN